MVVLRRYALVLLACSAALACGAPERTPSEIVAAYFRFLAVDPARTLPLLTPQFHHRHELGVVTAAQARGLKETTPTRAAGLATDRFQLGWLAIQSRPAFERIARGITARMTGERVDGDTAVVDVDVTPHKGSAFEQRFTLVRHAAGAAWRIDAIEQHGVAADNALGAFVAYPNEDARRSLEARAAPSSAR